MQRYHERKAQLTDEERANLREKIEAMPRKEKRARLTIRHGAIDRPSARPRSGLRTGTTRHFSAWMADLQVISQLQRLKLDRLADDLTGDLAAAFAILRVNGGIKSVWDLARCDLHYLLSVQQIGPKRLGAVEEYLTAKNVALNWTTR